MGCPSQILMLEYLENTQQKDIQWWSPKPKTSYDERLCSINRVYEESCPMEGSILGQLWIKLVDPIQSGN